MSDFDRYKLFVGGIPQDTTDFALKDHFSKYGDVSSLLIANDRVTGFPRGFGFVTLTNQSSFEKALADRHEILGKTVEVKKAISRSEQQQIRQAHQRGSSMGSTCSSCEIQFKTKKIFVGGLCADITKDEFQGYFEKFGTISDVVVMQDSITNRPRGFGFVTFDSEEAVEEVLKSSSFHELGGKFVEVKRAVPRDQFRRVGSGKNPRMDGIAFRQANYDCVPPYAYNGFYNAGYQMGGFYFSGIGMPMVATVSPWNGMHIAGYGPVPYASSSYVYQMNGLFGNVPCGANGLVGNIEVNGKSYPDGKGFVAF